jgi:hypothetical protein
MTAQASHYYNLGNQWRFVFKLMLEWTQTKETTFEIGILRAATPRIAIFCEAEPCTCEDTYQC